MSEGRYPPYERSLPPHTREDLVHSTDEFGRDHYHLKDGRAVCGRLKKRHNRQVPNEVCLAPPMRNGACKVHGGTKQVSTGRYARVLKSWRAAYERALKDKDLLDTRHELALMDVTIQKLLARIEELDAPAWRTELNETFQQLQTAVRSKRQRDVGPLLTRVGELVEQGAGIDQLARDLMAYADKRAARANKMDELALRREEKVTVSEVAAIFSRWLGVLEQHLDQALFLKIQEELRHVTEPGIAAAHDEVVDEDEAPEDLEEAVE